MGAGANTVSALQAWLSLTLTPGLGNALGRRLLARFGPHEEVLRHSLADLTAIVGADCAARLLATDPSRAAATADALKWLDGADTRAILTLDDARYPKRLLDLSDPPLLIYVAGDPQLLSSAALAIVGSRHASAAGLLQAGLMAQACTQAGLSVLSGLARGIDGAAHRGALEHGGRTFAFVGTGLDRVYPPQHRELAQAILERGDALASELPLGTGAMPANFPRRNRLIAAAALGVLVIEAARQSGSLITARQGAELGREVFAIPGSIHSPLARGCHLLLREGAKLVESFEDVLAELPPGLSQTMPRAAQRTPDLDPGPAPSAAPGDLHALGWDPVHMDALVERTAKDCAHWSTRLTGWELDGIVERLADGRWQRQR